jgi:hypothetical protein
MAEYGLEPHEYGPVVEGLRRNPQAWLEFMMRYDQQLLTLVLLYNRTATLPIELSRKQSRTITNRTLT